MSKSVEQLAEEYALLEQQMESVAKTALATDKQMQALLKVVESMAQSLEKLVGNADAAQFAFNELTVTISQLVLAENARRQAMLQTGTHQVYMPVKHP